MVIKLSIKTYLKFINILFILISSYLTSTILISLIARFLILSEEIVKPPTKTNYVIYKPKKHLYDYFDIERRYIFNAEHIDGYLKPVSLEQEKEEVTNPEELGLKLIGAIAEKAGSSIAIIQDKKENRTDIYSVGDIIKRTGHKVIDIKARSATLSKDGLNVVLEMDEYIAGKDKKEVIPKKKSALFRRPTEVPGITQIRDNTYEISDSTVQDIVENFAEIMMTGLVVTNRVGDEIDGFKVLRLDEDSLFKKVGFQEGDIIKGINGTPVQIESFEQAFKLFERYKDSKVITAEVERDGQVINLTFQRE